MNRRIKVKQRDITDCAAACLASVAAYYRLHIPVSRIRQWAGTDQQGTTVQGLLEAATSLRLQARAVRGNADSLPGVPLPCIAHMLLAHGGTHYVVIYKVSSRSVKYMDPVMGIMYREPRSIFAAKWTGVLLLLMPADDFEPGKRKSSVFKRFYQLARPHRGLLMQALAGGIFYTVLGLSMSLFVRQIVDVVIPERNEELLSIMGFAMLLILGCQGILGYFKSLIMLQTGQRMDSTLILGYYKHLLRLPQRFFDTMRVGEIMSRINDAVKIRVFINDVAMSMFVNALITVLSIAIMFCFNWKLALLMSSILPLYCLLYVVSNGINKKWQRQLMETAAGLETQLLESIGSIGTIKKFGLESFSLERTESKFIPLLRAIYRSGAAAAGINGLSEWVTRFFTVMLLWSGAWFVLQHQLTVGELLSFYSLTGYFTGPAISLLASNRNMQEALIAADRLFEIIDLETTDQQNGSVQSRLTPSGDIRFTGVQFRYGGRIPVLQNIDLLIRKGEIVAITGESGSGKSSLLSVLQRSYPITRGEISIGGVDIRYVDPAALATCMAVVTQEIELFAGTILSNISPGDRAPDLQRLLEIGRRLGIDELVSKWPAGYDTLLQERGSNLSGGQRQRIAIARALYRNAEILLLDEASSALDTATESTVHEAIEWFGRQGKTIVLVAHRLSTIRRADRVIVLHAGSVAADLSLDQYLSQYTNSEWQQAGP